MKTLIKLKEHSTGKTILVSPGRIVTVKPYDACMQVIMDNGDCIETTTTVDEIYEEANK